MQTFCHEFPADFSVLRVPSTSINLLMSKANANFLQLRELRNTPVDANCLTMLRLFRGITSRQGVGKEDLRGRHG